MDQRVKHFSRDRTEIESAGIHRQFGGDWIQAFVPRQGGFAFARASASRTRGSLSSSPFTASNCGENASNLWGLDGVTQSNRQVIKPHYYYD